ncbi:GntR family transcriptional regulator, partial [Mycobacterium sp. ITM-2017-0098]
DHAVLVDHIASRDADRAARTAGELLDGILEGLSC